MIHSQWGDLPETVRGDIEGKCGSVTAVELATAGINSDFAATLEASSGRVFCKGIAADSRKAWMHRNEAEVNAWLPHSVAPRLLWRIETDGWLLLGFDHVAGQHADLSPDSDDLSRVAETVAVLGEALTPCPPVRVASLAEHWAQLSAWRKLSADVPGQLDPWCRSNLDRFVGWESRAFDLIVGDTLLHTDLQSFNILVDDTARVIDWAWSRKGAAWVDAAFLVIRLIGAGHSPEQAEKWASDIPAWRDATEPAVTAFAVAVTGIWEHLQITSPMPHRARLANMVRQWAKYRLSCEREP